MLRTSAGCTTRSTARRWPVCTASSRDSSTRRGWETARPTAVQRGPRKPWESQKQCLRPITSIDIDPYDVPCVASGAVAKTVKVPALTRALVGEGLGTFLLVLFGTGSAASAVVTGALQGLWQVAVGCGFGVAGVIYCTVGRRGAHPESRDN